jgi:hypothetical protein
MTPARCPSCQAALDVPGGIAPGGAVLCPACGAACAADAPESELDFGPPDAGRSAGGEGARAQAAVASAVFWLGLFVLLSAISLAFVCVGAVFLGLGSPSPEQVLILAGAALRALEVAFAAVALVGLQRRKFPGLVLAGAILVLVGGAFDLVGLVRAAVRFRQAVPNHAAGALFTLLLLALLVALEGLAGVKTLRVWNNPRVQESFRKSRGG